MKVNKHYHPVRERQAETESDKEEGNVRPNKLIIHNAFPAM